VKQFNREISLLSALPSAAKDLLEFAGSKRIFLIEGPMGAGKTTFIKELCRALGSSDDFGSPTFSLVNEYKYPSGRIYHFDLYRLKDRNELPDIGFEEYIDSGNYCFIEWPELAMDFIDAGFVKVKIVAEEGSRWISASPDL
jgi:tRNA threonylcarbamoyladenosine biosynthesis protein TsaE